MSRKASFTKRTLLYLFFRVRSPLYPKISNPKGLEIFGASDVTRTRDLLITSEMHYRLCYTSIICLAIISVFQLKVNSFLYWAKLDCMNGEEVV